MCGITGYIDLESPIEQAHIFPMLDSIYHRGPDDKGIYFDTNVAFGVRRLSIIDLKTGHQPICNEDKSIWVIFNGEIYNFWNLRKNLLQKHHSFATKTDTEVLVHLYEHYGEDFPRYLNGMFTFALWDRKQKKLILGRDHAGIKPLYIYQKGEKVVFGSELKTILKYPKIKKQIDLDALDLYASLGYIPQPFSILKNIYKLKPGSIFIFSPNGKKEKIFWDFANIKKTQDSSLHNVLTQSVALQSRADVPLGVFLSGGIDSSLITYYLSRMQKRKIKTFSISFKEKSFDESPYFNQVAKILGTQHYDDSFDASDALSLFPDIVEQLDEPLADPSLLPTYKLCRLARKHVTVVLSGDGGDELFGGYPTYQGHVWANSMQRLPAFAIRLLIYISQKFPQKFSNYSLQEQLDIFLSGLKLPSYQRHLLWMGIDKTNPNLHLKKSNWFKEISGNVDKLSFPKRTKMQILDFLTYLTDDLLVKVDRASMYNSLEVRVPFLDPNVIQYAFSTQNHVDHFTTKKQLRTLLKDILPGEIIRRKKKGFGIPIASWIHGPMKELVYDHITNPTLHDYFNKKMIQRIWDKHQRQEYNYARKLWMLTMFSAWLYEWKTK